MVHYIDRYTKVEVDSACYINHVKLDGGTMAVFIGYPNGFYEVHKYHTEHTIGILEELIAIKIDSWLSSHRKSVGGTFE